LLPSELAPRWRDLPALAWLATDRLAGPVGRVRGLGLIARLGSWPATMMSLAGAHAEGACAAYQRSAALTVQQQYPRRWRWRHGLLFQAVLPVGVAVLLIVPLTVLIGGLVGENLGLAVGGTVGSIGAAAAMLMIAGLMVLEVSAGLGALAPGDRAATRAWAREYRRGAAGSQHARSRSG
jgi:hypothetical protein